MRLPRLGPGPVFVYEWLASTRRWQLYALRSIFIALILLGISLMWYGTTKGQRTIDQEISIDEAANFGMLLYGTIAVIELSLVLLAAPAATAGAICLDKARGTLDHMLATDLSNAEIVLGKLGVRLIPVIGLIACVLPVTALIGLQGGVASQALVGSFLTILGAAVLCCSLALMLSVWGRKTHEVLMLTYIITVFWLIAPMLIPMAAWVILGSQMNGPFVNYWLPLLIFTNPYVLLFTSIWPAFTSARGSNPDDITVHLIFLAVCVAVSSLLIALATFRVRGVALRQAGVAATAQKRWRFAFWKQDRPVPQVEHSRPRRLEWLTRSLGPSLDRNPVLWREWHMGRPTRMLRVARFLYSALGCFWLLIVVKTFSQPGNPDLEGEIAPMIAFQVSLGLLLLSVSASTSLAEERVRGSLDILLSTPMSTRSILLGKWWGSFRQIRLPLFWAALLGLPLMVSGRPFNYLLMLALISAYGAAIASLGLELATSVTRLGRAIALCVSAYLSFSLGWIILVGLLNEGPDDNAYAHWMIASPPAGSFLAASNIASPGVVNQGRIVGLSTSILLWTLFILAIAAMIFAKTVKTFDRHLGRIPEKAHHPAIPPRPI